MKVKIQWKLMTSYLTLVLLIGGILYAYLSHTLEKNLMAEARENLLNEARLVRIMASREISDLERDAYAMAKAAGKEIRARVTVISSNGTVVGDSELTKDNLRALENHAGRPEFQQALQSGTGISTRYSSTLRTNMMYVALPFQTSNKESAVVRLALPLARIGQALSSLHTILGAAILLAILCSLFFSYFLSSITSRPLRAMASAAARIGRGEFGSRLHVTSRDEIGELAAVMNEMAARIEEQLERISAEKNRLDTILRGMGEGVVVTDNAGVITLANPAFRSLLSPVDEIEGKTLIEITRQPSLINALKKVLETRQEIMEEMTVLVPEEKFLMTHWVPLMDGESLLGVVAVFHDITDLKLLEKVRKDFVANVSHELRTPVSVIKGYSETLLSEGRNLPFEKSVQFIEVIHNHAERLANLISDLLTLSRIESGAISLEPAPVSLDSSVDRAVRLLEGKTRAGNLTVTVTDSIKSAPQVLADAGKLEQVLVNLLDNAVKFTPEGGTITVSAEDAGTHVRVNVSDTGIGIPPHDIPRIFERFYRVDAARSRDMGGTGLGLSIVKHIVQAHGGTVSVASVPGRGSTFSFTLKKA